MPDPTTNPIAEPSNSPAVSATGSPTVTCNQEPAVRDVLIRIFVNTVSDSDVVGTEGTPQNQAVRWLIDQDTRFLCPENPTLISRYALAVFYYSTRGDRWLECSAPASFNDAAAIEAANAACTIQSFPDSGSDAWLTPGDECQWGGVVCSDDGDVEIINIGTLCFLVIKSSEIIQQVLTYSFILLTLHRTKWIVRNASIGTTSIHIVTISATSRGCYLWIDSIRDR